MATLLMKQLSLNSVEISLPIPLESMDVYWQWRSVVAQFLSSAFLHRSACLITVSPQPWSLGHELTPEPEIVIAHTPYLLAFNESCSAELLAKVSESEDFERGLLWLIAIDKNHKTEIIDLVCAIVASDSSLSIPQISQELMRNESDGSVIFWLNSHQSLHDIARAAEKLAQSLGWSFNIISTDPFVSGYEE